MLEKNYRSLSAINLLMCFFASSSISIYLMYTKMLSKLLFSASLPNMAVMALILLILFFVKYHLTKKVFSGRSCFFTIFRFVFAYLIFASAIFLYEFVFASEFGDCSLFSYLLFLMIACWISFFETLLFLRDRSLSDFLSLIVINSFSYIGVLISKLLFYFLIILVYQAVGQIRLYSWDNPYVAQHLEGDIVYLKQRSLGGTGALLLYQNNKVSAFLDNVLFTSREHAILNENSNSEKYPVINIRNSQPITTLLRRPYAFHVTNMGGMYQLFEKSRLEGEPDHDGQRSVYSASLAAYHVRNGASEQMILPNLYEHYIDEYHGCYIYTRHSECSRVSFDSSKGASTEVCRDFSFGVVKQCGRAIANIVDGASNPQVVGDFLYYLKNKEIIRHNLSNGDTSVAFDVQTEKFVVSPDGMHLLASVLSGKLIHESRFLVLVELGSGVKHIIDEGSFSSFSFVSPL